MLFYHFASQQLWIGVEVGWSGSCASVGIIMSAFKKKNPLDSTLCIVMFYKFNMWIKM